VAFGRQAGGNGGLMKNRQVGNEAKTAKTSVVKWRRGCRWRGYKRCGGMFYVMLDIDAVFID
jgi:hypothetical protein